MALWGGLDHRRPRLRHGKGGRVVAHQEVTLSSHLWRDASHARLPRHLAGGHLEARWPDGPLAAAACRVGHGSATAAHAHGQCAS